MKYLLCIALFFIWTVETAAALSEPTAPSQDTFSDADRHIYKTTDQGELALHIFTPQDHAPTDRRGAAIFFFGGGWNGGNVGQFVPHCRYLASRGMVGIVADYRVKSRHDTSPFECVHDGKSAMRWVREHADELGIDPSRIAAGGGSAGGHVAAATATAITLNDPGDNLDINPVPDALLLFNPVYDNGPEGYGYDRVADRYLEISPMHNIREGMPPAIVFLGTNDSLIPVSTAEEFRQRMLDVGTKSELFLYDGQPHGFFNHRDFRNHAAGRYYHDTVFHMDRFLESHGFVEGEPTIQPLKFELVPSDDGDATWLEVRFGGRAVARYMHAFDDSTEASRLETYKPYLHVYDQAGENFITKGAGGQYPHHRGIFVGYNRLDFMGERFDLWHMSNGVQVHTEFVEQIAEAEVASFTSRIEWRTNAGELILTEDRTYRFLIPSGRAHALIELQSKLVAGEEAIVLDGDPEHAGAQFRPSDKVVREATTYQFHEEEIDPKEDLDLPWVGITFQIGETRHSVVLLNHSENPTGTIFSAYRDYGRFGAFPRCELGPGETVKLRYRWVVADGQMLGAQAIQNANWE